MPITRIEGPRMPSMPLTLIRMPTPTCTAWANEASRTTPSGAEERSQVPDTTSGADIAGSRGVMARSSTGDRTAPWARVADAAW